MPEYSVNPLGWMSMTATVNEVRSPLSFLRNKFFGTEMTSPTKEVEVGTIRRGRKMAPLVRRGGAGVMVSGGSEEFRKVLPAHIRIKRPMTPSELINNRRVGTPIHITRGGQMEAAIRQYVARELGYMMDDIANTEEYLCALAIRGSIDYEDEQHVSMTVDFGRSASHDITLSGTDLWTDAASSPSDTFLTVSELVNDDSECIVTDCILGSTARDAFLANDEVRAKFLWRPEAVKQGVVDFMQQFQADGALFLGMYDRSIRVWSYARQLTLPESMGGTAVDLIRPKYAEFLCGSANAQSKMLYGAIEDFDASPTGFVESKRFAKSWISKDPSARMELVESNPLPVLFRPDTTCSVQVVA